VHFQLSLTGAANKITYLKYGSVGRGTDGALLFVLPQAALVEGVHAQEVDGRQVERRSARGALGILKDARSRLQLGHLGTHGRSLVLWGELSFRSSVRLGINWAAEAGSFKVETKDGRKQRRGGSYSRFKVPLFLSSVFIGAVWHMHNGAA
jgi:hypothetical protein